MSSVSEDILMHYGVKRRSGRYPWGSGDSPFQRSGDFLNRVEELRKQKFSFTDENGKTWTGDNAIAKSMGLNSGEFRMAVGIATDDRRSIEVATYKDLKNKGFSNAEIARQMGKNESTIRSYADEEAERRMNAARNTADFLKKRLDEYEMIEIGAGVEHSLNVSAQKLDQAVYMLEMEGYERYGIGIPQPNNPGTQTTVTLLCRPGTKYSDAYNNLDKIGSVEDYISYDGGETFKPGFTYPASMDSKRLKIRYAEEGGTEKDGVIELRRGVKDLSLGNDLYSQVRILVDGTHYLKGMAVYSDDMPDGVDVIFNTNKKKGTPALGPKDNTVLKNIKNDPNNPFGSAIKEHGGQSWYDDGDGTQKLSLINKRASEGDWSDWKDKLPSQFLSKQNLSLINRQLGLAIADKEAEFNEIRSLTNPTVKKALLQSFAEDCDSAAVHLQAAALPRQKYHVILPVTSMKDNEVYAPNYEDGETVALIRYPHGGTFEIPILKVNNKQRDAQKMLGKTPSDAIGINSKVAERLSGADFDGDTVMVIPCNSSKSKVNIVSREQLKDLKGFDPKTEYPYREGMRVMKNTQTEMGKISNLITDMTIKGANDADLAKAVKHSMVVIDAEKHRLDYKRSEIENDIATLKKIYQGRIDENGKFKTGAATIVSRAKNEKSVPKRQGSPKIDPDTGDLIWKTADDLYYVDKKTGKTVMRTQKSTQMAETKDARTLSSGHPKEEAYANYANTMKDLARQARKEITKTGKIAYSSSAKATYQKEVDSLEAKVRVAEQNSPRERQAQIIANAAVKARKQDNPSMSKDELKKVGTQELNRARSIVGAKKERVKVSDREWEAIQAGAISETQLKKILSNSDMDVIREKATPRTYTTLSPAKTNKIQRMYDSGNYTIVEIAASVGVSSSTINKYLNNK